MLINLRGTHGSGKSTIVRTLLDANDALPIYGLLGRQRAEAYALLGKTFVLGPYTQQCGGLDAVQPYQLIVPLIMKYGAVGHVIFEGALVSSCWGVVGRLIERWGRDAIIAFLDTSAAECIARVEARRAERGDSRAFNPKNLIAKHATIEKQKVELAAAGIVQTITVSSESAVATVEALLKGE